MDKYNKTIIAPIIATFAIVIGAFFGISIGATDQETVVASIGLIAGAGLQLYGIFKSHEKTPDEK